jgi:acetyl esterase
MTTRHMVDPLVMAVLDMFPEMQPNMENILQVRAQGLGIGEEAPPPAITPDTKFADGRDNAPPVRLLVFNPPSESRMRASILHIHGGGMILGTADMSLASAPLIALMNDVVIVSVDYRLAPETPFPGPQEDCYAGLQWLVANAKELGVDPAKISVMGESAGGGLAAALAHIVRDRGEVNLAGQILIYPMLDHRTGGPVCQHNNPMTGEFIWTSALNQFGWEALRGDYQVDDNRAGWFSPSRARLHHGGSA